MTVFYSFPHQQSFVDVGGENKSEYAKNGVAYSVIGATYEPEEEWDEENPRPENYEPVLVAFLVNTTSPVSGWGEYECFPESPMRIFG